MPKKKRGNNRQVKIAIGDIRNVSGNLNVGGGDISIHNTTTGMNPEDFNKLFDQIYTAIEARFISSATGKADLKAEVQDIQTAVLEAAKKNDKVDEGFLSRRFRNIARMAPDILDVVVATLANPLAGLGIAVKKIAEKAKEGIGSA